MPRGLDTDFSNSLHLHCLKVFYQPLTLMTEQKQEVTDLSLNLAGTCMSQYKTGASRPQDDGTRMLRRSYGGF